MNKRFLTYLVAILSLPVFNSACDIVNPGTRPIRSQLTYIDTTVGYLQALNRWWPWIAPELNIAGPAFGTTPFAIPVSFSTAVSAVMLPGSVSVTPTTFNCPEACEVYWGGSMTSPSFAVTSAYAADGHLIAATATIDARILGDWLQQIDSNGQVYSIKLTNAEFSPLGIWRASISDRIQVSYGFRKGITGALAISEDTSVSTQDLQVLRDSIPWQTLPENATYLHQLEGTHRVLKTQINYSSGVTTLRTFHSGSNWRLSSPGLESGLGTLDTGIWMTTLLFEPEQRLARVNTTIRRQPATGPIQSIEIVEERVTHKGLRSVISVSGEIDRGILKLTWNESDIITGRVNISTFDLGWHIEGFWDSVQGDLIQVLAENYLWNFWTGSFQGWEATDLDIPSESGDWSMLSDGLFQVDVLFKQINDTLTVVPVAFPPEGLANWTFE